MLNLNTSLEIFRVTYLMWKYEVVKIKHEIISLGDKRERSIAKCMKLYATDHGRFVVAF